MNARGTNVTDGALNTKHMQKNQGKHPEYKPDGNENPPLRWRMANNAKPHLLIGILYRSLKLN